MEGEDAEDILQSWYKYEKFSNFKFSRRNSRLLLQLLSEPDPSNADNPAATDDHG